MGDIGVSASIFLFLSSCAVTAAILVVGLFTMMLRDVMEKEYGFIRKVGGGIVIVFIIAWAIGNISNVISLFEKRAKETCVEKVE